MEDMKAIAGCAAALTTQTGSIGYLGPLINFETAGWLPPLFWCPLLLREHA